jgi:hypothetical protein
MGMLDAQLAVLQAKFDKAEVKIPAGMNSRKQRNLPEAEYQESVTQRIGKIGAA